MIEHVVVDMNRLIQKNLLSTRLHWGHYGFILGVQVIEVKLLCFDVEDGASNPVARVAFALKFENIHTVVVASTKVVQGGMAIHDPVAVCILARLMDLNTALHIPKAHGSVL